MPHRGPRFTLTAPVAALAAVTSLAAALIVAAVPAAAAPAVEPAGAGGLPAGESAAGTALTPPMGWNDWYQYRCGITQAEVLANASALVSSGLAALGYDYVNLDDCWMAPARASNGTLQADPKRFPNGIAWLASQVHGMGLRLGVYESFGTTTCQKLPGSYGHYQQDADTFANWGVDLLKLDYCGVPSGTTSASLQADYKQMSQDLRATGRPIVFSEELPIAAGDANPANADYLPYVALSSQISNMWRVAPDLTTNFAATVFGHLANDLPLASYARPGAWNDLDMLPTGNTAYKWTLQQEETQMSIWAELASPLIVSTGLTSLSAATKTVLGNKAVVAVDQDPLGKQGHLVAKQNGVDIVARPLSGGDVAVLLANPSTAAQTASTTAGAVGLAKAGAYSVTDLWANTSRASAGTITQTVPAQSAVLLRVSKATPPSGTPTLDGLTWLSAVNGYGAVGINRNHYGGPLSIHNVVYGHGLWVNSVATISYYLGGICTTFTADLGLDDSDKGTGAVIYRIYADGKQVYASGVVTNSTPTIHASVNVTGAEVLELYVGTGNGTTSYGNADFGTPRLTC